MVLGASLRAALSSSTKSRIWRVRTSSSFIAPSFGNTCRRSRVSSSDTVARPSGSRLLIHFREYSATVSGWPLGRSALASATAAMVWRYLHEGPLGAGIPAGQPGRSLAQVKGNHATVTALAKQERGDSG